MFSYIIGLLIIGLVFYIAGIYASSDLALLGFSGVCLLILSFIITYRHKRSIREIMEIPITLTEQGKCIKVLLHKMCKGKQFAGRVVFILSIENTSLKHKKYIKQSVSGGEKGVFQLTLEQAGNYEICIRKVRVYDLAGIFYLSKRSRERASVQVLPDIYPVNIRLTEGVRNFVGDAEIYDTLRCGDDASETFKLREFQDGDKLKNIHWKLSAKEDKLMVRENSLPKACSTVLLLDSGAEGTRKDLKKKNLTDSYLRAAASLSFSMMDMECPHYVAWVSKRYGEIKRLRVDSEESFYEFLLYLLQDYDWDAEENCLEGYREKYSSEVLMHHLVLKQEPALYEETTLIHVLDGEKLGKSLEEMELIL